MDGSVFKLCATPKPNLGKCVEEIRYHVIEVPVIKSMKIFTLKKQYLAIFYRTNRYLKTPKVMEEI